MTDYSKETVVQLKALLKAKGLSVDGKKAELIQRLIDSEAAAGNGEVVEQQPEASEAAAAPAEEPVEAQQEQQVDATDPTAPAPIPEATNGNVDQAAGEVSETPIEQEQAPKEVSPEERKQLAVELLTKKIHRAEKFGDEAAAEVAKKDLARVQKFGVELGTALAREIGLVDKTLSDKKFHRRKFNGKKKKNHNKVTKGGRGGRNNNK
ncbi:uncharacterized protein KQ657_000656 [Scheffersomyces spartinae]|uniref:SAP domain-containing protein n=1 Tax=Scheffersomyces spartinae TaxID=45513 RepID=A0A9P7V900_9ASCO|nr:uncharacterized protein KQ657_000656 [Scheffersomyces spartinae]KAG7193586.1 hypothetical protein KQ657_000656 [Scheffersomyces spartinae]